MTPTNESLSVFWHGEEQPGMIFYALAAPALPAINLPVDLLSSSAEGSYARLFGRAWIIDVWDVLMPRWPDPHQWAEGLRFTLEHLISCGYRTAWMSTEGAPIAEPPELFHPDASADSVVAAMTSKRALYCDSTLDGPLHYLSPDIMLELREQSRGLADVE